MATAEVRRYWSRLVDGGCLICGGPAEIAHAHGGSMVERTNEPKAKGRKLPRWDWLALPLCPAHHRLGPHALDNNVAAWERLYGRQADHIDALCKRFDLDLWTLSASTKQTLPRAA